MTSVDTRGNPVGSSDAEAHAGVEQALWRMMSFYDTPLADLDAAIAADPGWAIPHVMKAGYLVGLTEPSLVPDAEAELARADAAAAAGAAPPRERAHLDAVRLACAGRWDAACARWDEILLAHPRDALALQWVHLFDFYRGDAAGLRQRPARVLADWDEADRLYPHVLALHAFGLEECNLYPQAEETGRRALAIDPRVPWAVHAVAHVMEMQGRYEDGSAWLRQHQPMWADGNGFACHLWWHKGLFRLEAMDAAGVLRLVDAHLAGDALQIGLQRVDAISLLWRLHLLGVDVASRCAAILDAWRLDDADAGHYAFNDLHAIVAMIGADQVGRAESWLARCAERALAPADAARTNHAMAREVGIPVMRGLIALARGDADGAVDAIYPVRSRAARVGGSHAQRDLVDQTLLGAAARGNRRDVGRALVAERAMAKPVTPLTRHWMDRLAQPSRSRA